MSSNIVESFREYIISRINCYKMTKANLSVRAELANACEHLEHLIENNGWISINDFDGKIEGVKYLLLDESGRITIGELIKKRNAHRAHGHYLSGIDDKFIFELITTSSDFVYGTYRRIALISKFKYWQYLPELPKE